MASMLPHRPNAEAVGKNSKLVRDAVKCGCFLAHSISFHHRNVLLN